MSQSVKFNARFRFHKERYRTAEDVAKLFPEEEIEHLEEARDGSFSWRDPEDGKAYPIITEDKLLQTIEKEFKQVPPSFGIRKLHTYLARKYIGIRQSDVKNFLRHNEEHSKHSNRRNVSKVQVTVSSGPFKQFMIDVMFIAPREDEQRVATRGVPNDNRRGVVTVIDLFSKFAQVSPTLSARGANGKKLANKPILTYLEDIFRRHGKPGAVRADNEFGSREFKKFFEDRGIKLVLATAGAPESQGAVESFNGVIRKYMESRRSSKENVDTSIQKSVKAYNSSMHSATKMAPIDLHKKDLDEITRQRVFDRLLTEARKRTSSKANVQALQPELEAGQSVRVLKTALDTDLRQKQKRGHLKGAEQPWTDEIFTVKRQEANRFVWLMEFEGRKFRRNDLLLVHEGEANPIRERDRLEEQKQND